MTARLNGPSAAIRIRVMKRDRFKCTYCGAPGTDIELEIDHIIPVAHGGSHHISNLTTACRACNQQKGTKAAPPLRDESQAKPKRNGTSGLPVGLWLRTRSNGKIEKQGQIVGLDGDRVLVQLYEWILGSPSKVAVFDKSYIYSDDVTLYPTNDHMIDAYERENRLPAGSSRLEF